MGLGPCADTGHRQAGQDNHKGALILRRRVCSGCCRTDHRERSPHSAGMLHRQAHGNRKQARAHNRRDKADDDRRGASAHSRRGEQAAG